VNSGATQQLAEADPAGWAFGDACLARRHALESKRRCLLPPGSLARGRQAHLGATMIGSLKFCRRILLTSAGLFVAAGLVAAAGSIPPVKADVLPSATPQKAVAAFGGNVAFSLLAAAALAFIALRAAGRSRLSTAVLGLLESLALLLAFALTDAAFAHQTRGPAMQTAPILLHHECHGLHVILFSAQPPISLLSHRSPRGGAGHYNRAPFSREEAFPFPKTKCSFFPRSSVPFSQEAVFLFPKKT